MKRKKTIAFLVDFFTEDYQAEILKGAEAEALSHDINLVTVCGGPLNAPEEHHRPRNAAYSLVSNHSVDGIILLGSTIGNFIDTDELLNFYQQFLPLPVVSIGADYSQNGIPSILVENSIGMKKAMEHLITEHGYSRIAFICGTEGNAEAELRFKAYQEVLQKHNIPFDPELVCPGNFYFGSGINAVRLLMDERKVHFDALLGSSDLMAVEALRELQRRGVQVPYETAVVGFDDIEASKYLSPPLTTVRQPLAIIGRESVRAVIKLFQGESVPALQRFPTELTLRRSCGCSSHKTISASLPQGSETQFPSENKEEFLESVEKIIVTNHYMKGHKKWAIVICDALILALNRNNPELFIKEFYRFILLLLHERFEILEWQMTFRQIMDKLSYFSQSAVGESFAGILSGKVAEIIMEKKLEQLFNQKKQSNEFSRKLHVMSIELTTTFSLDRLKVMIQTMLPDLGINHFYIALLDKGNPGILRLYLSYHKGRIIELPPEQTTISREELFRTICAKKDGRASFAVLTLYFKDEQIGFAAYEIAPIEGLVYETLSIQLSSTLMGAQLIHDIEETQREVLFTLGDILEKRSYETGSHVKRVAEYSYLLALKYGLSVDEAQLLKQASPMHDIGKLGIEENILVKPDKLTLEEFDTVKAHTTIGFEILRKSERKLLKAAAVIAHEHHEYYDGSGYPQGLKGDEISIYGRITCLADVFDALGSHRVYKQEWTEEKIVQYLLDKRGKMFDPDLVNLFLDNITEFNQIKETM